MMKADQTIQFKYLVRYLGQRFRCGITGLSILYICVYACVGHTAFDPKSKLGFQLSRTRREHIYIRVRISEAVSVSKIRGFDLQIYQKKASGLSPLLSADKSSEWELHCRNGQILLHSLSSKSKPYRLSEGVSIRTPVGFISYGNVPYRDEIQIYSVRDHCEVINVLDLEKYLDGLVNSEFSSKWNEESIEAQVVAARTYAFYQIQEAKARKGSHFDLDATVKDQVYGGALRESFHSSLAAEKTKGVVLTARGGKKIYAIKAFYHSTCGGSTELPENVWGKSSLGFNKTVLCPYCSSSPRYRWDVELEAKDIANAVIKGVQVDGVLSGWPAEASQVLQQNHLLDVRITQLNQDGRVARITTAWANGKSIVELPMAGARFRDWMGGMRLRSTWFQLLSAGTGDGRRWRFQGRGNGHGVGLCQWGAKTMGEKGFKMATILKHYYPDAVLLKLW